MNNRIVFLNLDNFCIINSRKQCQNKCYHDFPSSTQLSHFLLKHAITLGCIFSSLYFVSIPNQILSYFGIFTFCLNGRGLPKPASEAISRLRCPSDLNKPGPRLQNRLSTGMQSLLLAWHSVFVAKPTLYVTVGYNHLI